MKQKLIFIFLIVACLMAGCIKRTEAPKQYQMTFLDLFDTVTSIVGYAESEEAFQEKVQPVHDLLLEYHQLFDIYHTYDGINNLKTVNDQAGVEPVVVDERIIQMLKDCRIYYEVTEGKVNAAMGSVLSLWHEARSEGRDDPQNAKLPDEKKLQEASAHMSFDTVLIDEENCTVFIQDPKTSLDVGAIAKGWAVQKAAEQMPDGILLSVGGNVCASGPKDEKGTPWIVGITNPDDASEDYLQTLCITEGSVVTSGDYQRVYVVDGKNYHHIVDPETLYPSKYWRSVSVVCSDSGVADMLSTALFLLPVEEGQKLLDRYAAAAMWVGMDGKIVYSPGFEELEK